MTTFLDLLGVISGACAVLFAAAALLLPCADVVAGGELFTWN
ncbi:hypothetical protein [Planotetraspora mira]|nr:hypothetical protein [Planotetraspora mira]